MAQKVQVLLEDDLSGGPAEGTIRFGLDGTGYEIDLNAQNASKLRNIFQPYVEGARKTTGTRRRTRPATNRERSAEIRIWAKQAGIAVNDRGRIPTDVIAQYDAVH
jgi:hypothetical protein